MRGMVKSGTIGVPLYTIPAGAGLSAAGSLIHAANSNEAMSRLDTTTGGGVLLSGSTSWFSLDGVTYLRES